MIHGAHVILSSTDPDADRAFFRDVLEFPSVDAGGRWLIFALPPTEPAVHPAPPGAGHELFLMCDDIGVFVHRMSGELGVGAQTRAASAGEPCVHLTLPGGGTLGVYQPSHQLPITQG